MRDIDYIREGYLSTDGALAKEGLAATVESERLNTQLKRFVNDCAYFLLAFSRFEDVVRDRARELVTNRVKRQDWIERTPWDVFGDIERLPFMSLVALLFEKGNGDYNRIHARYENRNEIAHGGLIETGIAILPFILELESLERRFPTP